MVEGEESEMSALFTDHNEAKVSVQRRKEVGVQ
jgi:hypothetical protein